MPAPSAPARHALEVFTARGARTVPELGAGHGRDALWLASQGMRVHGDGIFEHGGSAVHFFDRALVDDLAQGWALGELAPFEEGELLRRLWRLTQSKSVLG